MNSIFMNSKNSKTTDPHKQLILQIKQISKVVINMLLYQISAFTTQRKIKKHHTNTINLKYQYQRGMISSNQLINYILHQIFKIISSISSKKHETISDNSPIRVYVNKTENII